MMDLRLSLLLTGLMAAGCAGMVQSRPAAESAVFERRCVPPQLLQSYSIEQFKGPGKQAEPSKADTRPGFSPQAVEVAELIGVVPLLNEMSILQQAGKRVSLEFVQARQMLTDRLLLTTLEVSGTVAEIICERDRADQVADRMNDIDASRVKGLTLTSILIGGVASIVSGGIGLAGGASSAGEAVDVAGGFFESVFGVTALVTKSRHEFRHERNLLTEVWNDPDRTSLFPETVWRFLHRKPAQLDRTLREDLVSAWRQEGRLGEPGSSGEQKRIELMFGTGGSYTAPELKARAAMLETLEATVRLITEDLELLMRDVLKGEVIRSF